MTSSKKIAVIGAGISGLTTAYLLKKKGHKVTLFEKSFRAGGYIGTQNKNGFIVEAGASSFLNNEPKTLDLIQQLNLNDQLIEAKKDSKIRYLYFNQKLHKAPTSPKDIFSSSILSLGAKFKLALESVFPPKALESYTDQTVYSLFKRHFGEEVAENIVRTALIGIYAGDARKLSAEATIPKIVDIIKTHKSLIKGMKEQFKNNKPSTLHSFKTGMQALIDRLSAELRSEIKLSTEVSNVALSTKGALLSLIDENGAESESDFNEVVITTPIDSMTSMLEALVDSEVLKAASLATVAPVRTLSLAFSKKLDFTGFGVLISPNEKKQILGFLHPSDIFEGRCPQDKDLITVMMGGEFHPEVLSASTQHSLDIAIKELTALLGPLPPVEATWIWNHIPGIAQYTLESVKNLDSFHKNLLQKTKNIHLNVQARGGVSINDCIRKSFELADRL